MYCNLSNGPTKLFGLMVCSISYRGSPRTFGWNLFRVTCVWSLRRSNKWICKQRWEYRKVAQFMQSPQLWILLRVPDAKAGAGSLLSILGMPIVVWRSNLTKSIRAYSKFTLDKAQRGSQGIQYFKMQQKNRSTLRSVASITAAALPTCIEFPTRKWGLVKILAGSSFPHP